MLKKFGISAFETAMSQFADTTFTFIRTDKVKLVTGRKEPFPQRIEIGLKTLSSFGDRVTKAHDCKALLLSCHESETGQNKQYEDRIAFGHLFYFTRYFFPLLMKMPLVGLRETTPVSVYVLVSLFLFGTTIRLIWVVTELA